MNRGKKVKIDREWFKQNSKNFFFRMPLIIVILIFVYIHFKYGYVGIKSYLIFGVVAGIIITFYDKLSSRKST